MSKAVEIPVRVEHDQHLTEAAAHVAALVTGQEAVLPRINAPQVRERLQAGTMADPQMWNGDQIFQAPRSAVVDDGGAAANFDRHQADSRWNQFAPAGSHRR